MKKRSILKSISFIAMSIIISSNIISCASNKIKDQVEIVGNSLGGVEIKDLRSMQINNLLVAQGTFHNNNKKVINAYYRCKFFDATNFQVGDDQVWQLLTIYSNQDQAFKCQAIDSNAVNFKIEFSNNAENVTIYH